MLVRHDGERLNALLKRLDKATGLALLNDVIVDEVNGGESGGSNVKQLRRTGAREK